MLEKRFSSSRIIFVSDDSAAQDFRPNSSESLPPIAALQWRFAFSLNGTVPSLSPEQAVYLP